MLTINNKKTLPCFFQIWTINYQYNVTLVFPVIFFVCLMAFVQVIIFIILTHVAIIYYLATKILKKCLFWVRKPQTNYQTFSALSIALHRLYKNDFIVVSHTPIIMAITRIKWMLCDEALALICISWAYRKIYI